LKPPTSVIDSLAFGGNGVCRIEGKVCFVPFSCPGDEVYLRITSQKKAYSIASISELLNPSSQRDIPVCKIFGSCGGCCWQHISYPVQLEQKRNILAESLRRSTRVKDILIDNTEASPLQYGYRSRMQFKVSAQKGVLKIGFFRKGTHLVEDAVEGCPIAVPVINQVINKFRKFLGSYPEVESISQIDIDAGENGVVVVLHQSGKISLKNKMQIIEKVPDFGPCSGLFIKSDKNLHVEKLWGDSRISYSLNKVGNSPGNFTLTYPPTGFAQVNQMQNRALLSIVHRLGGFKSSDHLLDLYCGNGNFSIPLAAEVAAITGIEWNSESILAAEHNIKLNKVANIKFICDDVSLALGQLADEGCKFDAVLLDPPRSGATDSVPRIARLQPKKIIYVSCDPSTLARDCGLFLTFGYSFVRSIPIDMFPNTHHIESVTLLSR
jgi:23S rRNA (uracil1939-C5)-methyltransferase